ncbi:MAG: IS21 family transposase [Campylobacterales bacterium]|nr:IS21 family transposase [Campylobacterales bacterium]
MEKLSMLKIKELFRLKYEARLSARQIGRSLNVSHSIINRYLQRLKKSGMTYAEAVTLDDRELLIRLFKLQQPPSKYPLPDWIYVHEQLRRFDHVTLELLHEEYRTSYPDGHYGYTWFCAQYKAYAKKLTPSMRQIHKAGEKVFIDYSGLRMPYSDPITGEVHEAEIFVAVLGASGYPFVMAVPSQKKADFFAAHVAMFKAFGGVPELLIPDNLKSAVIKTDTYEPDLNPDYVKLSEHYGCAIMPARPYKPKDKAKVEHGVKLTQRWIMARLRHHQFFSIAQINSAIRELMPLYRNKIIKHLGKSRQELFDTLDKPALKPLPLTPYEYRAFKLLTSSIDYHVTLDHAFYSVPYQLMHKKVKVWYSDTTVSICFEGKEVALHPRLKHKGAYSTHREHMSSAHQKYLEWSPGRIMNWGATIGPHTVTLLRTIMERRPHPEMGYRSCLGIMNTFKRYHERDDGDALDKEALDAVAKYACTSQQFRLAQIKTLLKSPLKHSADTEEAGLFELANHDNIRSSAYYR